MLAVPLLLYTAAVLSAPDASAAVSKGATLYRGCQAEVRLMDLPSLTKASESDLLNGSFCVGYLNGFVANLRHQDAVCTDGSPIASLVRIYVEFMTKNPSLMDEDRRVGLHLALRDAFPCPVDSPRPTPDAAGTPGARSTL